MAQARRQNLSLQNQMGEISSMRDTMLGIDTGIDLEADMRGNQILVDHRQG